MDMKNALDILIAVAICSTNNIDLSCSDCPMAPEECELTKSSEVVEEAIRLLKDVQALDPNPAIPGKWVLVKMLNVPVANIGPVLDADIRATEMDSVPLYEEPLKGRINNE